MFILSSTNTNAVDDTIQNVVESSNYFIRWWNSIEWSSVTSEIITKAIYIILILIFFAILKRVIKTVLKRTFERKGRRIITSENRSGTIYKMLDNAVSYIIAFFIIYSVLSIIGIPVSTLLAGAGITGIAIGLGAQSFISDIVNGFFILLENQFDVGDSVKIGDISGNIVSIGLRSTQIKGFDGTLYFLPNHTIEVISNYSRNEMRANVDLTLYPDTDLALINSIMQKVDEETIPNHPEIIKGPTYFGPTNIGNGLISYQIMFYTLNGEQFQIQHLFLKEYLDAFQKAGIKMPTPNIIREG